MSWLVLAFALQLGYTPNDWMNQYQAPRWIESSRSQLVVSMDGELRAWGVLYVGGSFGVPMWIDNGGIFSVQGWPSALQSVVRAGVRFRGVEIGWSHLCTHPVMPFQPMTSERTLWEGGYDEVHVKFSGEIHL